jgi:hypothetical protein
MRTSRSKIGCSVIDTKGLVIRSRCLPDFHQTEINVALDLQSTNSQIRFVWLLREIAVSESLVDAG